MSPAAPPGWRLQMHDELGSTQDSAIEAAKHGEAGRLAIMARRQTAGRGRGGRAWEAPAGNLNLSVLLRPARTKLSPGHWALLAGVALHDTLTRVAPTATHLRLKWPNDILRGGAKLGGILIESATGPDMALDWIVIGFGVNIASAPTLDDRETAYLAQTHANISAGMIAHALLARLDHALAQSRERIRTEWLGRAHPLGTKLRVRLGETRGETWGETWIDGIFDGLNKDGALLLQGRSAPIHSGDILLHDTANVVAAPCS